jgi:crossover junction endodeoxyribonuclease RuvC
LGHVRGVICLLAQQSGIEYHEYPATRVKKVTTGNGHASKLQMRKMIEHASGVATESLGPVDATDAIALAMAHAYIAAVNA